MTIDEAITQAAARLDSIIDEKLAELAARIRRDMFVTGPGDDSILDAPPNLDSPWRLSTVEQLLMLERERLLAWRDKKLAEVRADLVVWQAPLKTE